MKESTYNVSIKECNKELTARERVMIKDITNAVKLDEAANEKFVMHPAFYAILNIHNEKSPDKDYENYIIIDKDGTKYVTGSPSFWNSFIGIYDEMMEAGDEEWGLEVYKLDSKNYSGKKFITCSIV